MSRCSRAFTLVELLVVVVVLGILVAVVIPQYANATADAQLKATQDQLIKIRRAMDVYYVRNNNMLPAVTEGNGTWGQIANPGDTYLRERPLNQWVGGPNAGLIVFRTGPDTSFHTNYGWIFDPATGRTWAASFDGDDVPFAR
ncbi:MAG: prepilin-type N-terminal cleavage/methylation domain-containing protein [Phycisphaeraceae bacterium]|nr:prepilin-type N-terminal cleavage/methylation domain-containing protein [Phycisphaeraceae bacterium]